MEPEIVYRWAGPRDPEGNPAPADRMIPGVPARDLTADDLAAMPGHLRASIAASDLYEAIGRQPPADEEGE